MASDFLLHHVEDHHDERAAVLLRGLALELPLDCALEVLLLAIEIVLLVAVEVLLLVLGRTPRSSRSHQCAALCSPSNLQLSWSRAPVQLVFS